MAMSTSTEGDGVKDSNMKAGEAEFVSHGPDDIRDLDDDDDEDGGESSSTKSVPKKKSSGRRRIVIEYIRHKSRRHITFSKRKAGIMKKAFELSVLTGIQMLLLIASETGHVYTYATAKLQPMITTEEAKNMIQRCLNAVDDQPTQLQPKDSSDDDTSPAQQVAPVVSSNQAQALALPLQSASILQQQQFLQQQLQQQQAAVQAQQQQIQMRQQQELGAQQLRHQNMQHAVQQHQQPSNVMTIQQQQLHQQQQQTYQLHYPQQQPQMMFGSGMMMHQQQQLIQQQQQYLKMQQDHQLHLNSQTQSLPTNGGQ